jgi:glucose 1-dehydrogenase
VPKTLSWVRGTGRDKLRSVGQEEIPLSASSHSDNSLLHIFGLKDQIAIVTGATSGLGRACAIALGQAGAAVVVNHLPGGEDAAAQVVRGIQEKGGRATTFAADVSQEEDVRAMFADAVQRFGTVHILVNNAGIQSGARFQEMTLEQWRRVMAVNLDGQFLCAREAVREFSGADRSPKSPPQPERSSA